MHHLLSYAKNTDVDNDDDVGTSAGAAAATPVSGGDDIGGTEPSSLLAVNFS